MDISKVTGHTQYKGFTTLQHENVFETFRHLLKETTPSRILEIGTAGGGFTLFLRDALDDLGLSKVPIKSFEIIDQDHYRILRDKGIEVIIQNIFDHSYLNLEKPEAVDSFIKSEGLTLVLCDGGHKKAEFKQLAQLIKPGDIIMAHDYISTYDNFTKNFVGKIWDWREIGDEDIGEVCRQLNLESYFEESLNKVVWVCKIKR